MNVKFKGDIYKKIKSKMGQIAILIDPDKFDFNKGDELIRKMEFAKVDYIFIGGSTVERDLYNKVSFYLKSNTNLPLVSFPGDVYQYSENIDAILYLSLLSGRNPEYLIGQHIHTSKEISELPLEILPTSYLLIDGDKQTAVSYVSQTTPIPQDQVSIIERTVLAGILQGKHLSYLDAGSGAKKCISPEIIKKCSSLNHPIIVGGGIRTLEQMEDFKKAGANVIVIGNHIEENIDFLLDVKSFQEKQN